MKAIWNNEIAVESDDTVVVEGNHYFPADSADRRVLVESSHSSYCPWKGTANYYSLAVNGETYVDAAWYCARPKQAAREIAGRIAFWRGVGIVA